MEKLPSIRVNYTFNLMYQILTLLTPFITTPYVSRILGADGTGVQSYTNSIVSYFAILAALGTASYGQREIARHRNDKKQRSILFWEIELLCAFSTAVCLLVWLVLIVCSKEYTRYYIVLTMTLIGTAFDISWFFGGLEQYKLIAVRNMIVKLIGIAVLFLLVKSKDDLLLYVALLAATGMFGNISMWGYLKRFICRVNFSDLNILRHFKDTIIYFIPTVATSIYTILDKTMLGLLTADKSENGYYEYATGFVNMAKVLLISFNAVMSSRMSYLFAREDYADIEKHTRSSLKFVMFLGFPITFGLMGIAAGFIPWFLGAGYAPVIPLLYVLSPLVLIVGLSDYMGSQILTPSGQRARSSKVIVAGSCINIVLNMLLIPHFKSFGAAAASIAAELIITLMYFYMCRTYIRISDIIRLGYKNIIAGIVMFLIVVFVGQVLPDSIVLTVLQVFLGALVYTVILLILRDDTIMDTIKEIRGKFSGDR